MRSQKLASVLPFLIASLGLAGCAAPQSGDGSDDQTQDVTGGSTAIESPVVFLFASDAPATAAPACAGAMLADNFAVTAKACAKEGMSLGRAADKDGRGARARVAKIHAPTQADADIVVVELDKPLAGTNAVITHMPLRSGYSVNAFAATAGKGLFSPDKNGASTVTAAMIEETATHGSIVPVKGTEICDGDIGAPVCSVTGSKIGGFNVYGTCGLSGLVVSRIASPAPAAAVDPAAAKCSGGAWKVAQLGQHADFLKTFAPKAFQPLVIDKPILRNFPYAPDGLWGYKTKGDVKTCTLDAATLATVAPSAASAQLSAKVSYAAMDKNASMFGRFGIAPKSKPTEMRWLPAKSLTAAGGVAFDAQFQGVVSADAPGDYVVAFRASANGGETWTQCDTDGAANGYSVDKALSLKVVDPKAPSPTPGTTPPATTPQGTTPPASGDGSYSDPPASSGDTAERDPAAAGDPSAPAKKKATDSQGCSMSSTSPLGGSSSLPIAGVLLGLVALARRRGKSGSK